MMKSKTRHARNCERMTSSFEKFTRIVLVASLLSLIPNFAGALPPDCDEICTGNNPSQVCAIPWAFRVTTCGQWCDDYDWFCFGFSEATNAALPEWDPLFALFEGVNLQDPNQCAQNEI